MNKGDIVLYKHNIKRDQHFYGIVNGPHPRIPEYFSVTLYTPSGVNKWNKDFSCLADKLELIEEA